MLCDDQEGRVRGGRETQEGGDICICIADSCCCTAETNTTLPREEAVSSRPREEAIARSASEGRQGQLVI